MTETLNLTTEPPVEDRLIVFSQRPYPSAKERIQEQGTAETTREPAEITRERMRGTLALSLTLALAVVVVFALVYVWTVSAREQTTEDLVAVLQGIGSSLLTPLVGLIGAVTGFYYGGQATAQTAAQTAAQTVAQVGDSGLR
jgi:hypothetical protein